MVAADGERRQSSGCRDTPRAASTLRQARWPDSATSPMPPAPETAAQARISKIAVNAQVSNPALVQRTQVLQHGRDRGRCNSGHGTPS